MIQIGQREWKLSKKRRIANHSHFRFVAARGLNVFAHEVLWELMGCWVFPGNYLSSKIQDNYLSCKTITPR